MKYKAYKSYFIHLAINGLKWHYSGFEILQGGMLYFNCQQKITVVGAEKFKITD